MRVRQPLYHPGLNLPNSLAREPELPASFFKRARRLPAPAQAPRNSISAFLFWNDIGEQIRKGVLEILRLNVVHKVLNVRQP